MKIKNLKLIMALGISLTFITGCSNMKKIGTIGGINFYKVHGGQFDGPNFTALVTETPDKQVKVEYVFGSAGIGSSIIAAGGNIGAAAVLGTSFPKNVGDNNSVSGGNVNTSNANNNSNNNSNNNKSNNKNNNGGGGGKDDKDYSGGGKGHGSSNGNGHNNDNVPGKGHDKWDKQQSINYVDSDHSRVNNVWRMRIFD